MPAYRKSRGLFSAKDDLVFIYQFADILKSNRRFVQFESPIFGNSVNQVRRCNASCYAFSPPAAFSQIICQKSDQLVRRYERSVAVDHTKSVAVSVRRKPQCQTFCPDQLAKLT